MSGINRNETAQSNVEFTSFIHPVVKFPESLRCCKVKFMVDYISMKYEPLHRHFSLDSRVHANTLKLTSHCLYRKYSCLHCYLLNSPLLPDNTMYIRV